MSIDTALSYGTLDTQASTAGIESQAGVTMAMFELNWASFEPRPGAVSASYLATMRTGLATGMTPNPYPNWRPGQPGLRPAQIDRWVNWYVGGLANVTTWQMRSLSRLGFTGY